VADGRAGTAVSDPPSPGRRGPRHRRRRRHVRLWVTLIAIVALLGALGGVAAIRLSRPEPVAAVRTTLAPARVVPGTVPAPPWPTGVQAAFVIPALGVSRESGPEQPAPVASLTKVMTAYLILKDHPLSGDDPGPTVTMSAANVADFDQDNQTDQSNVQIAVGEVLTERQLLEGLLVHSANDFADALAEWDSGNLAAFVVKMNTTAQLLGMHDSHFVDPSGFDPQSQSTPADILKIIRIDMEFPVFAQIVAMPSVTLPVAGTVRSSTPLLGAPGIVGVKSGWTMAAGGCDVLGLIARVDHQLVLVLAAVTGEQQGALPIEVAGLAALALAKAVATSVVGVRVATKGAVMARASVAGTSTPAVAVANRVLLGWPGQVIRASFVPSPPPIAGARAGRLIGRATFSLAGQEVVVDVRTRRPLPTPSLLHRLV